MPWFRVYSFNGNWTKMYLADAKKYHWCRDADDALLLDKAGVDWWLSSVWAHQHYQDYFERAA